MAPSLCLLFYVMKTTTTSAAMKPVDSTRRNYVVFALAWSARSLKLLKHFPYSLHMFVDSQLLKFTLSSTFEGHKLQ